MRKLFMFLTVLALLFAVPAQAQQLKVATGGPKGTYSQMFREINSFCAESIQMSEVQTSGSVENLSLLLDNQASAAFVQTDVLFFKDKTDNIQGQVKTVIALHPEEVHFVAPVVSKLKVGGTLGFGKKTVLFNNVGDLAGARVGAAGGSYITAQLIRLQSEVAYQVVQFNSNDEVKAALDRGDIEVGLFVGGQPLGIVASLGPDYKLLPVPDGVADKLKNVYRVTSLKYPKITPNSIKTVATDALFVTGNYRTPRMVGALKALHDCVLEHIPDYQETTGYHAKWRQVDPENQGKWPSIYTFPKVEAPARKRK